jgi:hypothetical protein
VDFRFSKVLRNGQVLRRRQLWNMQHKRFMLHQCCLQGRQRLGQHDVGKVEVKHFGANRGAELTDRERYGHSKSPGRSGGSARVVSHLDISV